MVDIHCHVLFGVDDGCKNLEESIALLKEGYDFGFREFYLTSHFIYRKYENKNYEKNFLKLEKEIENKSLKVKIYRGNEIYLDENINLLLKEKKFNTLNGSKDVLVEFAPYTLSSVAEIMLKKVIESGYRPILAHVERYEKITISDLMRYKRLGVKLQLNIGSIPNLKKGLSELLKNKEIDFLGSDAHGYGNRNYKLKKFYGEGGEKDEREVSNGSFFRSIFRSIFSRDRNRGDTK